MSKTEKVELCLKIGEPPLKLKYAIKTDSEISTVRERWTRTINWSEIELEIKYLKAVGFLHINHK